MAWKTLDNYREYGEFDFLNSDSITEHSIYYFGRGLANIAASTGDWEYVNIALAILKDANGMLRESERCPL